LLWKRRRPQWHIRIYIDETFPCAWKTKTLSIRYLHLNSETMEPLIRDRHLHFQTGRLWWGPKTCCGWTFRAILRGLWEIACSLLQ
jgi:hypothetical protein